jgi:hypothetical protein
MLLWIIFLILIIGCLYSREGYTSPPPVKYTDDTKQKFYVSEPRPSSTFDRIKRSTEANAYQKWGVPEASVLSYITNKKWPISSGFGKVMNMKSLSVPEEQFIRQLAVVEGASQLSALKAKGLVCKRNESLACMVNACNVYGDTMWSTDSNGNPKTPIANENLPSTISQFQFIGKPCNPCVILENNYSCPFAIPSSDNKRSLLPPKILQYVWDMTK